MSLDISNVDPKKNIIIKGAQLHNLKNIDVVIQGINSLLSQDCQGRENHH